MVRPKRSDHHILSNIGEKNVWITGKISSFSKHYHHRSKFRLSLISIRQKNIPVKKVNGDIQATVFGQPDSELVFGDIIRFPGVIRPIHSFSNPGGFDYVLYMKQQKIYGTCSINSNKISFVKGKSKNMSDHFLGRVELLRNSFTRHIFNTEFSNKESSNILLCLLCGRKEAVSNDLRDLFSKSGTSHLLAISGLHLSIVGLIFYQAFFRLFSLNYTALNRGWAKKGALVLTMIPLIAYGIFSGFSASTQRALIMAGVLLLSFCFENEKDIVASLGIAGILILLFDPGALFSISFQLSFSAVFFIVYGMRLINFDSVLFKHTVLSRISMLILVTFFAGLGTLPFTAHYFHIITPSQLIANVIAVPVIGFIVLPLGLVSLATFWFSPVLSSTILQLSGGLIHLVIDFCKGIEQIPFAWIRVTTFTWLDIFLFFLASAGCYRIIRHHPLQKKYLGSLIAGCLLLSAGSSFVLKSFKSLPPFHVCVLDIGQNNSAVITTPEKHTILVDAGGFGHYSSFDTGRSIIAPYLWGRGITTLDAVILTHPDADHMNGLVFIMENFNVRMMIKNTDKSGSDSYLRLMSACKKKGVKLVIPDMHKRIFDFGSVQLEFFPFRSGDNTGSRNNNSLVFNARYKRINVLFTGDILKTREQLLAANWADEIKADILLSPHHGSNSSSTKFFLDKVQPQSVIISCGRFNRYGFPGHAALDRYRSRRIRILRTDRHGAVCIGSNGFKYNISTNKGG